jgi:4-amino-4-deoxy-L-arabinose transferase-like glycosyltransferase
MSSNRDQEHLLKNTTSSPIAIPDWALLGGLGLLAALMLFWRLGQGSLVDWDEAIHAQVAKQMVQGGDWVTPYWGEEHWFRKPLLSIWARAILFQLFAVNELWARAGSALCGIGLVILTYLIGKRVHGRTAGLLSALVLLSSYPFVLQARFATTDIAPIGDYRTKVIFESMD